MTLRRLPKLWLACACAIVALAWAALAATGAQPLTAEKLDGIRVGDPDPDPGTGDGGGSGLNSKCCLWAAQQPCGYNCVANPLCPPAGTVTKGSCGNATCADATPAYNCNSPARTANAKVNKCQATGGSAPQGCPVVNNVQTLRCRYVYWLPNDDGNDQTVSIQACNYSDSICNGSWFNPGVPVQPPDACSVP